LVNFFFYSGKKASQYIPFYQIDDNNIIIITHEMNNK